MLQIGKNSFALDLTDIFIFQYFIAEPFVKVFYIADFQILAEGPRFKLKPSLHQWFLLTVVKPLTVRRKSKTM